MYHVQLFEVKIIWNLELTEYDVHINTNPAE